MASLVLHLLASFGFCYVILDSEILSPLRQRLWPNFDCYFCLGFWAGATIRVLHYLPSGYPSFPPALGDVVMHALASCAACGLLSLVLDLFRSEEGEGP